MGLLTIVGSICVCIALVIHLIHDILGFFRERRATRPTEDKSDGQELTAASPYPLSNLIKRLTGIVGLGLFMAGVVLTNRSIDDRLDLLTEPVDRQASSRHEFDTAIKNATKRIWICQTWFPGHASDADRFVAAPCSDYRFLLASFKEGSHIWGRIQGRDDVVKPEFAMSYVSGCVAKLMGGIKRREQKHGGQIGVEVRFNFGHHPGWIAVIDDDVFWGPTPVEVDNQSKDLFFHRANIGTKAGQFWRDQFELLWHHYSHECHQEKQHNTELECTVFEAES